MSFEALTEGTFDSANLRLLEIYMSKCHRSSGFCLCLTEKEIEVKVVWLAELTGLSIR